MWCDNCLCIFPLRAGAMALGLLMAIIELGGGIFLFKYGNIFFTMNYYESVIYSSYAMAQGALVCLALIALATRSYVLSRFVFLVYPVIILLGAIRAGIMIYSLDHYGFRIDWSCKNGGISWITANDSAKYGQLPPSQYDYPQIPAIFCNLGVPCIISLFTLFLIADFLFMLYFFFLLWRFTVRLVHYPVQKNEFVYP